MLITDPLHQAYQRTALQRVGISFDAAMATPMFKNCLQRVADAINTIHQPPLPREVTQPKWQQFKD